MHFAAADSCRKIRYMSHNSSSAKRHQLISQLAAVSHRISGPVKFLWLYLLLVNLLTFILFGVDKYKAVHHLWRIRETVLLGFALAGGSLGGWLGLWVFHHKTHVPQFYLGLPLMALVQIVLLILGLR